LPFKTVGWVEGEKEREEEGEVGRGNPAWMPGAFLILPGHVGVRNLGVHAPKAQLLSTKERMGEEG
jgi:hypothetical protein